MKKIIRHIPFACLLLATLLAGCVREEDFEVPAVRGEGETSLLLSFRTNTPSVVVSRATPVDLLMDAIDDVHILIFKDVSGVEGIDENTPVDKRDYIQYKTEQRVFLQPGAIYYVFAAANLNAGASYFDDVQKYGDLQKKILVQGASLIPDKLVMTTKGVVPVNLTDIGDKTSVIFLSRVQTQMRLNIYNKVDERGDIASGVYPVSFTGINIPRYSYLLDRGMKPGDTQSRGLDFSSYTDDEHKDTVFTRTATYLLPDPVETVTIGTTRYTRQTVYGFVFENRQGRVFTFKDRDGVVKNLTSVKDRKLAAPEFATIAQITSTTADKVLLTYMMPGQDLNGDLDVTNDYNIDRNCIYHLNVYIRGVNEVETDSRREYLDQLAVFTFPSDMVERVDAHYVDMPVYISGKNGRIKMQSGTSTLDPTTGNVKFIAGTKIPESWTPMLDSQSDSMRWLRFSFDNPFRPSTASTTLYSNLTAGTASIVPILHFNEYTAHIDKETVGIPRANDVPPRRTAVIRIGFVSEAKTDAAYEAAVRDNPENENVFYEVVKQWGMRTVGQVGGYEEARKRYMSLLGVESVEEYRHEHYKSQTTYNGIVWGFKSGLLNMNRPYDGKTATLLQYDAYRAQYGGVPPVLKDPREPAYDPIFNTFAADYCMRKNRDEDGNGIIEGSEHKWYLPTPVQLMQISLWRSAFQYHFNGTGTAAPFLDSYWSTNESTTQSAMALAMDLRVTNLSSDTKTIAKTLRQPVRCVRDIPGSDAGIFFITTYGGSAHLAGDVSEQLPVSVIADKEGWERTTVNDLTNNGVLQRTLVVSRYYVRANNNTNSGAITLGQGDQKGEACKNYTEPGETATGWRLPTQRELAFLYAYSSVIEYMLQWKFASAYDKFEPNISAGTSAFHWSTTNDGDQAHYWGIDFVTGNSEMFQKSKNGYYRCVKYVTRNSLTRDPQQP